MSTEMTGRRRDTRVASGAPDLPSQLETLFHLVWQCEREWRLDDRIDLALRREEAAHRGAGRG